MCWGVVLNNVDVRSDNQYSYYTSYYTYYSPSNIGSPRTGQKKLRKKEQKTDSCPNRAQESSRESARAAAPAGLKTICFNFVIPIVYEHTQPPLHAIDQLSKDRGHDHHPMRTFSRQSAERRATAAAERQDCNQHRWRAFR